MAVVQVTTAPSRDEYESVSKRLDLETDRPVGLIVHSAAELPSGEVQIVDVWESEETLRTFAEQRLFPAFADAGVMDRVQAGPPPVPAEAFHLVRG
jgi:hypothetical protein